MKARSNLSGLSFYLKLGILYPRPEATWASLIMYSKYKG